MSKYDLEGYNSADLRLMRNEIFAVHSYIFKSEDLKLHFQNQSWYKPRFSDFAEVEPYLSEIEKANVKMIQKAEKTAPVSFAR